MTDRFLNGRRIAELWQRCKREFGQTAGLDEVEEMLDEVFGAPSSPGIAADVEVSEMLDSIFGDLSAGETAADEEIEEMLNEVFSALSITKGE